VNSASSPSTATSRTEALRLVRHALGQGMQPQEEQADAQHRSDKKDAASTNRTSVSPGAVMKGGAHAERRVNGCRHDGTPLARGITETATGLGQRLVAAADPSSSQPNDTQRSTRLAMSLPASGRAALERGYPRERRLWEQRKAPRRENAGLLAASFKSLGSVAGDRMVAARRDRHPSGAETRGAFRAVRDSVEAVRSSLRSGESAGAAPEPERSGLMSVSAGSAELFPDVRQSRGGGRAGSEGQQDVHHLLAAARLLNIGDLPRPP
jgi:hypothetical protein